MIQRWIAKLGKLARILEDPVFRRALLRRRVAAGVEHMCPLRNLGEIGAVVDIGANRGQFALAARRWFPDAKIFSFEPLPVPAIVFRSVLGGDPQVVLHEVAIGPETAKAEMHLSARDDSSSLLPISGLQEKVFPGTKEVGRLDVDVAPLDFFFKGESLKFPALLKLDVQGFEYDALLGCESCLGEFRWVYSECSFVELYEGQRLATDVIKWLLERGFSLQGIYNVAYDKDGRAVQGDFLFERPSDA